MSDSGEKLFEELMRFRPEGLTANGWAVKAGVSRTIWADLKRHGNPSRRTLEKLLSAAGSSLAEFEALRVGHSPSVPAGAPNGLAEGSRGWRGPAIAGIPLLATRRAGEWGRQGSGIEPLAIDRTQVIGTVDRPAALAADANAYAVILVGSSMWPRFRADRRLLVSPAAAIAVGDDVLVELSDGRVLIKELVGRSEKQIDLRQFNRDLTISVDAAEVAAMHKIVGEAIS